MTHKVGAGETAMLRDLSFWNAVRDNVAARAMEMRRQGFFGAAMLPMSELEYTGIMDKLKTLDERFSLRQ
ncbi:MAG: fructose 1,6-bisphosphatase [Rhodocyclaceae bacterium]|nr:fructose 1,6-bisphosphatase [Rhodocyclaceae bacterium]